MEDRVMGDDSCFSQLLCMLINPVSYMTNFISEKGLFQNELKHL